MRNFTTFERFDEELIMYAKVQYLSKIMSRFFNDTGEECKLRLNIETITSTVASETNDVIKAKTKVIEVVEIKPAYISKCNSKRENKNDEK